MIFDEDFIGNVSHQSFALYTVDGFEVQVA